MKATPVSNLNDPISQLRGVGDSIQSKLSNLGLRAIGDLLFHLPLRYIDRTRLTPIGALQVGISAQAEGTIELCQVRYGKRRSLLCRISDGTGALTLRFFHFSKAQQNRLVNGATIRCYGQPRFGAQTLEMIHPEYQLIGENIIKPVEETLTPIYPTTQGINQFTLRKLTQQALHILHRQPEQLTELIPEEILKKFNMPELAPALEYVHRPPPDAAVSELIECRHPAQLRLAFEELLTQYLSLRQHRNKLKIRKACQIKINEPDNKKFITALPFRLTGAQTRTIDDIKSDLSQSHPMLRLVQGDVGSGKTVVAAIAAFIIVNKGYQAALMAPTELLAEQHATTLHQWLNKFNIPVIMVTGKQTRAVRQQNQEILESDTPCVIVGTHALFQQGIKFSSLQLIVIDEQHRFGVHQRLALLEKGTGKGTVPHQLIMTATPIPRTLAMTMYADLDISVIDELPPGRQQVSTSIISSSRREEIIERIRHATREGRQVYWVCTLIEESDVLQCETAVDTCKLLTEKLDGIRVGLIHGRLKSAEKETIMSDFKKGIIQLLVATTVIEVGVDVPNASLMIIENAERLGLFQIHQLRGRIGRGNIKSDCVLMYQPPLGELAKTRLETLRSTNDGFEIARKDMELRGPGELTGTRQTGMPELRIADLIRDAKLLPDVHKAAEIMNNNYTDQITALINRWLGSSMEYTKV